ncbi:MAG: FtsQ-type POTRA domain-containing protein [Nitriliruptoraceae bacterium]
MTALAVTAAAAWGVDASGWIDVHDIVVVGVDRQDPAAIVAASGIPNGPSMLRFSSSRAARRVDALPLIDRAQVARVDPNTVRITVAERQPVLVAVAGRQQVLIDRAGNIIDEGVIDTLPTVMLSNAPPLVGGHVTDSAALANAFAVWHGLSGSLRSAVMRYVAQSADSLTLFLERGPRGELEIRFGRAERIDEKVRAIGVVLADVGDTDVAVLDVRAPSTPALVVP